MLNIDYRWMFEFYWQNLDSINSPFAFPRIPPKANLPLGISKTGKLKENIIQDNSHMLTKLTDFHSAFQNYAAGLFDLAPSQFRPGHPLYSKMSSLDSMQLENEQLKKENITLTKELEKLKQK